MSQECIRGRHQGFDAVAGRSHLDREFLQHGRGDEQVRRIVVGDQHAQRPAEPGDLVLEPRVGGCVVALNRDRLVGDTQRQDEAKSSACARGRRRGDLAAHLLDELFADREPEPGTAETAVDRFVRLREVPEEICDC